MLFKGNKIYYVKSQTLILYLSEADIIFLVLKCERTKKNYLWSKAITYSDI